MDYLSTTIKLLAEEQENLWQFRFRSNNLSDQENYSRAVWDDEASRNIWTRYVYPFTDDLNDLMKSKESVVNDSNVIVNKSESLFNNCIEVHRLSNHIDDLMKESDREHTTSITCRDKSANLLNTIMNEAPAVDRRYSAEKGYRQRYNSLYAKKQRIYI